MANGVDQAPENDLPSRGTGLLDVAVPLARHIRLLVIAPLAAGVAALGITFLVPPTFTARTTFLPPQSQSSAGTAAAIAATLGALSGVAGSVKSPIDQYVSLLQSGTVSDRIIDRFDLMQVYEKALRTDARKALRDHVAVTVGKKDGLITVSVDDEDPRRAALIANAHVEELRRLSGELSLSEAQQRRSFFESHLRDTRDRLTKAQLELQQSGFNAGALKAEPKTAAEEYARLKAEITAAEVRLQTLRRHLADSTPEVQQLQATLAALRAQLSRQEATSEGRGEGGGDYISRFREFKYQETLFELYARQYELARLDESREGAVIQVIDAAVPPERRSRPKRVWVAATTVMSTLLLLCIAIIARDYWRRMVAHPATADKIEQVRTALGRRQG